jgi:hypothetical protein
LEKRHPVSTAWRFFIDCERPHPPSYAEKAFRAQRKTNNLSVTDVRPATTFLRGNGIAIFGFKVKKLLHPSARERVKSSRFLACLMA